MMSKRKLYSVIGLSVCALTALILNIGNTEKIVAQSVPEVQVIQSAAKYKIYSNPDQLSNDSKLIVRAKYSGQRETKDFKSTTGTIIDTVSLTKINIQEVFKGDLKKGDSIKVYEPGYYDNQGTYYNTEGYNIMSETGDYILFLKPTQVDDSYVIIGGYQGKFDTNLADEGKQKALKDKDFVGYEVDKFVDLKKQVLLRYTKN